jgi:hypothetical protein
MFIRKVDSMEEAEEMLSDDFGGSSPDSESGLDEDPVL